MIFRFLCLMLLSIFFSSCESEKINTEAKSSEKMKVVVQKIAPQERNKLLNFTGTVVSDDLLIVVSQIAGEIEKIHVRNGEKVKKNDLIIEIDNRELLNIVEQAKVNYEEKKMLHEAELELHKNDLSSNVALKMRELEMQSASTTLQNAKLALEKTRIKATFDGLVDEIFVHESDFVDAAQGLFHIINSDKLKIAFQVSEKDLHELHIGDAIIDVKNQNSLAKIDFISNIADQQNKTYKIEGFLSNVNNYKIGMPIDINVDTGKHFVYQIPSSALVSDDAGKVGVHAVDQNDQVVFYKIDELIDQDDENLLISIKDAYSNELDLIVVGQGFVKNGKFVIIQKNN